MTHITLHDGRRESLTTYNKKIGFLHPKKKKRLRQALDSYVNYQWQFPRQTSGCKAFVRQLMVSRSRCKENGIIRVNSIAKKNLTNLSALLKKFFLVESKVYGPRINGYGTAYYELVIQKKAEIEKVNHWLSI